MWPVLYTVGSYNVYSFGVFLAISFILSTFVVWKYAKEEFKEEEYLDAYFYTYFTALIFGRTVYILRNWSDFGLNILKYILVVETPGLSLLGGAIGGFIFLYFYVKKKKLKYYHLLDILAVATSLSLVFIKIGQQLSGAAFGKETNFFLKVRIVGLPSYHHPTEFYEAVLFFIVFLMLVFLYSRGQRRKWSEGTIFGIFILCLALVVFGLEFLKVYRVYLYGLSFRQFLALAIFGVGLLFILNRINFIKYFKKKQHEVSQKHTG